jgi:hypothetical protein
VAKGSSGALLWFLMAFASGVADLQAATFTVDVTTDSVDQVPGDGSCDNGSGECSLRAAVMEANALAGHDTILLPEATHELSIAVCGSEVVASDAVYEEQCADLDVLSHITIRGLGAYRSVVTAAALSGGSTEFNSGHFDVAASGSLELEDLMLLGGRQRGAGGAIRNRGGSFSLLRTVLYANIASLRGGAIDTVDGSALIERTLIAYNQASTGSAAGGGIFHSNSAPPASTTLRIVDSTISFNTAVRADAPNSDGNGGGLYLGPNAAVEMEQATVISNSATGRGGGIAFNVVDSVEIKGSTITNNRADMDGDASLAGGGNGGGIYSQASSATVEMVNTILAGNVDYSVQPSEDCLGPLAIDWSLIGSTASCLITGTNNLTNVDPEFTVFGDRGGDVPTVGFAPTSPAKDAANGVECSFNDARGRFRFQGGGCDLGAWESGYSPIFKPKISADTADLTPGDELCDGFPLPQFTSLFPCSLRAAVQEGTALGALTPVPTLIELGPFTYQVGGDSAAGAGEDLGETGDLDVFGDALVTIEGVGARSTMIEGTGFDRVFHAAGDSHLTLRELTVAGGAPPAGSSGGNVLVNGFGLLTLKLARISGGTAQNGGGIALFSGGSADLAQSLVADNVAVANGGGIYQGAASGNLALENTTLHNNDADQNGGGLAVNAGTYQLDFVTVRDNLADRDRNGSGDGGGVYFAEDETGSVNSSVIAGNRDGQFEQPDCAGLTDSVGNNFVRVHTTCGFVQATDQTGTSNAPLDPLLGPFSDNGGGTDSYEPLVGSPLRDAANPTGCPSADQRGVARPRDGNDDGQAVCDIGAIEAGQVPLFADGFESGDSTAWAASVP